MTRTHRAVVGTNRNPYVVDRHDFLIHNAVQPCFLCEGTGAYDAVGHPCPACHGTGELPKETDMAQTRRRPYPRPGSLTAERPERKYGKRGNARHKNTKRSTVRKAA